MYRGTICKEWTRMKTTRTYYDNIYKSESRLKEAIESGYIPRHGLEIASRVGTIGCMKQLVEMGCKVENIHFQSAAGYENPSHMKWLLANGCTNGCFLNKYAFENAAEHGSLENMKWLFANGCPFGSSFNAAAFHGNLDNMKWLLANGYRCSYHGGGLSPDSGNSCIFNAALHGNLENIQWISENGGSLNNNGIIHHLWNHDSNEKNVVFNAAALNGNLDNMKWLLANGGTFGRMTFQKAEKNGSFENMKWLLANGCPFSMMKNRSLRAQLRLDTFTPARAPL